MRPMAWWSRTQGLAEQPKKSVPKGIWIKCERCNATLYEADAKKLLDGGKKSPEVLDELYIRCLGRKPNETELKKLLPMIEATDKKAAQLNLEDVFWALLNANEFIFNH